MRIEVGKPLNNIEKRYQEGILFDITDSGATIITYYQAPTNHEIEQFQNGKIKLGYYTYKNVIMLLMKVGDLPWMDAPYSVHLSNNLTEDLEPMEEGKGLGLTICLADANNGIAKKLRLVAINNRLTNSLIKDISAQKEMSFDDYDNNLKYIFNTYSTKELVDRAKIVETLGSLK